VAGTAELTEEFALARYDKDGKLRPGRSASGGKVVAS